MTNVLINKGDLLTSNGTNDQILPAASNNCINIYDSTQSNGFVQKSFSFQTLNEVVTSAATYGSDPNINQIKYKLQSGDVLRFIHTPDSAHVANQSFSIYRTAKYSGAQGSGWTNAGLYVSTNVCAGANTNEWSIVGRTVSEGSGENVGIFGQGWKTGGAGSIWGSIGDAEDFTGSENTGSLIGAEFDCLANGTNTTYHNRIGAMIVTGTPTGVSGAASQCWNGLYVCSVSGGQTGYYKHGIHVGNDESMGQSRLTADIGIKVLTGGTNAMFAQGSYSGPIYYGENNTDLPVSAGNTKTFIEYHQKTGANTSCFIIDHLRAQNGSNWDTSNMRFYRQVDGTVMGAVEFRNLTDLTFNRSIALTMDGADFFEANLLRNMSVFKNPINLVSQSSNPTSGVPNSYFNALPNAGECNHYVKGGKLVWQYNDAGTIRYLSIPLTGTGTTFTHSTASP